MLMILPQLGEQTASSSRSRGITLDYELSSLKGFLYHQGWIVKEVFEEVERTGSPDDIITIISQYFMETTELIAEMVPSIDGNPVNFVMLEHPLYKLKGTSLSLGTKKVTSAVDKLIDSCTNRDVLGTRIAFMQLKDIHVATTNLLEKYLMIQQAIRSRSRY